MKAVLLFLSCIALGIGLFSLTNATFGIGMIGFACFFAILARIVQADYHQKELGTILAGVVNELKVDKSEEVKEVNLDNSIK